jgi:ABC-type lipoprotein release transport system permease subunit
MKCLGALDKFIVKIFILEAFFQGLIGSLGGAVLGTLSMTAMFVFEKGFKIFDVYPLTKILTYNMVAVTIGLAISIIGAVYPAYRAAKMEPIEAMRREV